MKLLNKVADYLKNHGRLRIIMDRDGKSDYMHRYYLWKNSAETEDWSRVKPHWNMFLHNFRASDDPYFHDHTWPWMTIILKGGYWEHVGCYEDNKWKEDVFWRGPGSILRKKATDLHWVELPENHDNNTWTLFFHGPRIRSWGFRDTTGKIPVWTYWKEFIKKPNRKTYKDYIHDRDKLVANKI